MILKTLAISQSNYIPWKGFFDMINSVDEFIIYDDMQFTKRDWRNRNLIKTPNGLQWLTIPVKVKGKYFQKINETEIEGNDWADKHWKTIQMNYSNAPFFKNTESKIQAMYEAASKERLLSQVNYIFLNGICKILDINTLLRWSSEFNLIDGKTEKLVDICLKTGATSYISGPAAKDYIDEEFFRKSGVNLKWMSYEGYPEYNQLWGGFIHGVTVIDMLFNCDPSSYSNMRSSKT